MDNLNNISYEEGWKDACTPVYKENLISNEENQIEIVAEKQKKYYNKPVVLIFQLIICFIIIAAAFCIRSYGGEFYQNARKWYYSNLNDEIFITENFESLDLDNIFNNEN